MQREHWPGTTGIYGLHQPTNRSKAALKIGRKGPHPLKLFKERRAKDNVTCEEPERGFTSHDDIWIKMRRPSNLLAGNLGLFKGLSELPKQSGAPRGHKTHPCPGSLLIAGPVP